MCIPVKLARLELLGLEIKPYGSAGDVCMISEATLRLGKSSVEKLERENIEGPRPRRLPAPASACHLNIARR